MIKQAFGKKNTFAEHSLSKHVPTEGSLEPETFNIHISKDFHLWQ
jgi:hypothetical protein